MPRYTVNKPVSAAGKVWKPREVLSERAARGIDPEHLVALADEPDPNGPDAWYDGRTIKSVVSSVGGDPDRAEFALARERERPEDRQRAGVFEALIPLVDHPADVEPEPEPVDAGEGEGGDGQ